MMCNKYFLPLLLLTISYPALASGESSATLTVTGRLLPAACTIMLDNGGIVQFGQRITSSLSDSEINGLTTKEIQLNIKCGSPTLLAWRAIDEQHQSTQPLPIKVPGNLTRTSQFGLGKTANGLNIGAYVITTQVSRVVSNISNVSVLYRKQGVSNWTQAEAGSTLSINSQGEEIITLSQDGSLQPMAYSDATFPLTVNAALQPGQMLNLTDEVTLQGETTICLIYL